MIQIRSAAKIYLRPGRTDFRKSINGLAAVVHETMKMDPYSGSYFIFFNRTKSMLKILYWDATEFCLWQKHLEADTFRWPKSESEIKLLTMQIELLNFKLYGRRSEKLSAEEVMQGRLFDEIEAHNEEEIRYRHAAIDHVFLVYLSLYPLQSQ